MDNRSQSAAPGFLFICLMVIFSVALSRLAMGLILFPLPVLLSVNGIWNKRKAIAVHLVSSVGVLGLTLISNRSLFSAEYLTIWLLGLVFPLTITVACTLWTALRDFSNSILRKLVICSFPTAVIALSFSVWLCLPGAQQSIETLRSFYTIVVPQSLSGEVTLDLGTVFIGVLKFGSVPVAILFQGIPIMISESLLHRGDEKWYFDFANMKMPYNYVWVYFGLLALSIITPRLSFVGQIPVVILWNLTFGLSIHFIFDGISVLVSLLRKRSMHFTPGKIMIWVALSLLIPGVNMFVLSALLATGIFENWIKLR